MLCNEGGLGIKSFTDVSLVFAIKQWWCIRTSDSLWAQFVRGKYARIGILPSVAAALYNQLHGIKSLR